MSSGAVDQHVLTVLGDLMDEVRRLVLAQERDGLRPSQLRVLGHVPPEGITVTELAERVGMTKQGVGQFVTQLADAGYLATEPDPDDRRLRRVRRTRAGDRASQRLARLLDGLETRWAERVGPRRYAAFRTTLEELAALSTTPV